MKIRFILLAAIFVVFTNVNAKNKKEHCQQD